MFGGPGRGWRSSRSKPVCKLRRMRGMGILRLRDADYGGQEEGGQGAEVEGGEGDALRFDVDA